MLIVDAHQLDQYHRVYRFSLRFRNEFIPIEVRTQKQGLKLSILLKKKFVTEKISQEEYDEAELVIFNEAWKVLHTLKFYWDRKCLQVVA